MFGSQIDDEFVNSISDRDAALRGHSQWPALTMLLIAFLVFLTWAYFYELEEVTSGLGRVIPSQKVQVVQTLEGGIVGSIDVKEGDTVELGQALMQIDDTRFASSLGELEQKRSAFEVERLRLLAEANSEEELKFSEELATQNPKAVQAEIQVFRSRKIQLANELQVLQDRVTQRQAQLEELNATQNKLQSTIAPLSKEVKLTKRLFQRKVVPEIDFLRLQSRLAELEGDLKVADAAVPKIEASIKEAESEMITTRTAYALTARERLAKLQAEISIVDETIRGATDKVTRTQLKSPVRGVVNKLNITTVGAVLEPGMSVIEIVPADDSLLIEAEIRPQDVAFIQPGERASIKLTAYDYLIYGSLQGKVVRIGADTIADKKGEEFFKVVVRSEKNFLGSGEKKYPIIPGMVASIDIQTGRKTVLSYLLKPVLRARSEAFRER